MPTRILFLALTLVVLALAGLGSCLMADGERCQANSDCESNYCCKSLIGSASPSDDGFCTPTEAACQEFWGADADADTSDTADTAGEDAAAEAEAEAEAAAEAEAEVAEDVTTDVPADTADDISAETMDDVPTDASPDA